MAADVGLEAGAEPVSEHQHKYVFLRSDKETLYYGTGRIREVKHYDVFFCEACLNYEVKLVKTEPYS